MIVQNVYNSGCISKNFSISLTRIKKYIYLILASVVARTQNVILPLFKRPVYFKKINTISVKIVSVWVFKFPVYEYMATIDSRKIF